MDAFAQAIAQFANLRTCARMLLQNNSVSNIRSLFPKASFDEQQVTRETLFEIAWSFLSEPTITQFVTSWKINGKFHRMGGLPAAIQHMTPHHITIVLWFEHGKRCNARHPTFVPD